MMKSILVFILTLITSLSVFAGDHVPQKIGFFTGTFDMFHMGHYNLAKRAIDELGLDKIIITPGYDQTHKPNASPFQIRDEMLKSGMAEVKEAIYLTPLELNAMIAGGMPALIGQVAKDYPEDKIYQIMGDDSLARLEEKNANGFPRNFIIVVSKRGDGVAPVEEIAGTPVRYLSEDTSGYSSTQFRGEIADGQRPPEIPERVFDIIVKYRLYGISGKLTCTSLFK